MRSRFEILTIIEYTGEGPNYGRELEDNRTEVSPLYFPFMKGINSRVSVDKTKERGSSYTRINQCGSTARTTTWLQNKRLS